MPEYRITWSGEVQGGQAGDEFITTAIDYDEAVLIAWDAAYESTAMNMMIEVGPVEDDRDRRG